MNSLLAFLAINLACFIAASIIALRCTFYRRLIDGLEEGRSGKIDGLRGWLALGVLFTHAANMYFYFSSGHWGSEATLFYGHTGPVGVCLFFMVTAFLFWGRVLRTEGNFPVREFYAARLRRIVPMYIASVFMVLGVVAVLSGFELRVSPLTLAKELRSWFSFGFIKEGDINGVQGARHINAVYWTLAYEWMFYLALPFLALFTRGAAFAAMLLVAALFCYSSPITLCFLFGALAAWSVERRTIPFPLAKHWLTPLPIAALLLAFTYGQVFALMPMLLLFVFFVFIVMNNSLFGLLATRGAKLLGTISYSIYLVHCIVLYVLVAAANAYMPIGKMDSGTYMVLVGAAAVLTVLLSAVTYRYIEHPFLSMRKRVTPAGAAATAPARRGVAPA